MFISMDGGGFSSTRINEQYGIAIEEGRMSHATPLVRVFHHGGKEYETVDDLAEGLKDVEFQGVKP
jgi:hypothetical protein